MSKKRFHLLFVIAILVGAALATAPATAQTDPRCAALIPLIAQNLSRNCFGLNTGTACYGNTNLAVDFNDPVAIATPFANAGDQTGVNYITTLRTSPLNLDTNEWGLAVLEMETLNAAGTFAGQSVTFLVYGDAQMVDNAAAGLTSANPNDLRTGQFNAFYFSTGVSADTPCLEEFPVGGLLVNTPSGGQRVSFNVNGVDVSMGSTVVFEAAPNGTMTIGVLRGSAVATLNRLSVEVRRLEQLDIPLGGSPNGLGAVGPLQAPVPFAMDLVHVLNLCSLAEAAGIASACTDAPAQAAPAAAATAAPTTIPPTATAAVCQATVSVASSFLRFQPYPQENTVARSALMGDRLVIVAQARGFSNPWYQINFNGELLWVAGSVLRLGEGCTSIPFVTAPAAPALPTRAATATPVSPVIVAPTAPPVIVAPGT